MWKMKFYFGIADTDCGMAGIYTEKKALKKLREYVSKKEARQILFDLVTKDKIRGFDHTFWIWFVDDISEVDSPQDLDEDEEE